MTAHFSDSGLAYTASDPDVVRDFEQAITSYLAARPDTLALLDAMLANDPAMPMAACFRGYLFKLAAHPRFADPLQASIAQAQSLAERSACSDREKAHIKALALWSQDQGDAALRVLETNLEQHPLDMLALRIAHYLHFYNGLGAQMRDSTARVLGSWDEDHPHYGYLLGMHAFGLEESGDYEAAERFGREAVARNPADIWATHASTHVFQMQNRHDEGIEWLSSLQDQWHDTNNFRYHLIWHQALHWLGLGEAGKALAIYDSTLADSVDDDFYLDVCNNASLLWRLTFIGIDVGERWQSLVEVAARHTLDRELAFASLHYLIPLALTGSDDAGKLLRTLDEWARSGGDQGRVCVDVGIALANAIDQSQRAPQTTARLLAKNQSLTFRIGGSAAQRNLFRLLAADSERRSKRSNVIEASQPGPSN